MVSDSKRLLNNKVVIVTGASSGLGQATVRAFRAAGSNVIAVARRTERLAALREENGCEIVAGDASDATICDTSLKLAQSRFGHVDILINNAGLGSYKQLVDTTVEEYDEMMRVNMRSSFLFSRAVTPGMIERGSGNIVFAASVAGVTGTANEAVYSTTKFAQVGFAQALDQELFPHGIKVTTLILGGMKTEFAVGRGRTVEEVAASPMMNPEDVAQTILYVCEQPQGIRLPAITLRHMGNRK